MALDLSTGGRIYLDTNVLIYSVETQAQYWPTLRPLWDAARAGRVQLLSSELIIAEALVEPMRRADHRMLAAYDAVFASVEFRLLPIDQVILRRTAQLRAAFGALRTPDAIHIATAEQSACTLFLTNDQRLSTAADRLPFKLLDELAA